MSSGFRRCADVVFRINRAHQQIGDEADHEQSGHQEHCRAVGFGLGHSRFNSGGGDVIDEAGTDQRRDGPGCDESTVDRANLIGAEHIAQIRRDGRKTATIHGDDDRCDSNEQRFILGHLCPWHCAIQNCAKDEVNAIDRPATDVIRNG